MDENSLSRIQPLLTICRYFGITYFTHKNTITTIFSFILNVVIKLTVVVIYIIRAYCYIPNLKLDTTSPVLTFNNAAQLILGLIYVILKWILYFAKRKKMEDIISKMVALDKNKLTATSCFPQTKKSCYTLMFFSIALLIMSLVPAATAPKQILTAMYIICFSLPHIMNMWETKLIVILSKCIANKLSSINALIQNQVHTHVNLKKVLRFNKPGMVDKFLQRESISTVERIRKIMEMHYQLTALSLEINELFASPILMMAGVNFRVATFCVYFFSAQVADADSVRLEMINIALHCAILIAEIVLIVAAFQGMQQMSQQTEEYIHDMWNAQIGLKRETIPVMQLASVQILLTKPTFSARGWFPLDMTFVHTFVGAVTTYTVILVQLNKLSTSG